jgi:hypothetical protein
VNPDGRNKGTVTSQNCYQRTHAPGIPRSGLVQFRLCTRVHNRKNWLHIGSPQAGSKVAAILSVVESCRRLKVSVRDYFSAILPGFADLPIRCLPDLTPAVWVARHS